MEYVSHYGSPLGGITLESDGEALTGLRFDRREDPAGAPGDAREKELPLFGQTKKWLDLYFGGKEPGFTPPLKIETTPFRRAVWEILLTIPYGKTATYGEIAKQIARQKGTRKMSSQAVGGAVGHNPIALIIPCHRVIGRGGDLVGYGGGIDRKAALLKLEGVDTELSVPKNKAASEIAAGQGNTLKIERCAWRDREGKSMSEYRFYGWETADIKDRCGRTPRDYYDLLSDIWCAKTCAPRMRENWSPENKTLGQCSITAFLLQDLYGGKVYGVPLDDGNFHCFNVVDGRAFDLTSEQFGGKILNYDGCPEQSRAVHFTKEEKRQRYELLKARLFARLEGEKK